MTTITNFPITGKKATDLTATGSPLSSTQIFFIADPTTGALTKATVAQMLAFIVANITSSQLATILGFTPQTQINTNTVLTMDGRPDVYAGIILMDSNGAHWKLTVTTVGDITTEHVGYNEGGEYYFGEP